MITRLRRISYLVMGWMALSISPAAWAGAGIELYGAGTYTMGVSNLTASSAMGLVGGGLGIEFGLGKAVDLTLRGSYLTRQYTILGSTTAMTMLEPSLGFGFHLGRALALELGGYYNYNLTNPDALAGSDYGAYAGLRLMIPIGSSAKFMINPQYHYALSTLTVGSLVTYTPHEAVLLVGFIFGGGAGK